MKYRVNEKNGQQLSILGFGCMRYPKKGNGIDVERTEKMIIEAIEKGVNYFDTAYIYMNGKSESILGATLEKGYRDQVYIATKLPPFMVKKIGDAERIFNTSLERLRTDRVDYYLIHMLPDLSTWERLTELGIQDWIAEKKKAGRIINLGFSYHGGKEEFKKIVDAYDWDFCQIQYNYLDENNQAGRTGLEYAYKKGLPVFIMEPLRGGKIVFGLPKEVNEIWDHAIPKRTPADWALRWVWNHKETTLLLSGMNTEEQLEENIRIASEVEAGEFGEKEIGLFEKAKKILSARTKVNCTACGYCLPCPAGVDIPTCFAGYNQKYLTGGLEVQFMYMMNTGAATATPANASLCVKCRKCESHCPQSIVISERMDDVKRAMEGPMFQIARGVAKRFLYNGKKKER